MRNGALFAGRLGDKFYPDCTQGDTIENGGHCKHTIKGTVCLYFRGQINFGSDSHLIKFEFPPVFAPPCMCTDGILAREKIS